jgi:plastocyanin
LSSLRNLAYALLAFAFTIAPAGATTIRGTTTATVVWISAPKDAPKPVQAVVTNHDRTFIPPLIVIPIHSTVRFPNEDPFYHSIYSTSKADPFDIGFYDTGPGKVVTFDNPGIIDLHCHIHASMHAVIVVVDGPYASASGGAYAIDDVSPGRYVLHAWSADTGERTMPIVVPASGTLTLDVNR